MFHKLSGEAQAPLRLRLTCGAAIFLLGLALAWVVIDSEAGKERLRDDVLSNMSISGVENPVTSVLLNFRSYDTLMEVAVLLIVAFATMPLVSRGSSSVELTAGKNAVLNALIRWLIPITVLMGTYMLWVGAYAPGGAFQAGALLAGAAVLWSLAGKACFSFAATGAKVLLTLGLFVFIAVGAGVALINGEFLNYPRASASVLILLIETAATLSIAATLFMLYEHLVRSRQK